MLYMIVEQGHVTVGPSQKLKLYAVFATMYPYDVSVRTRSCNSSASLLEFLGITPD